MDYAIVHDIPGRLRVHCTGLCLNPDSSLELNRWLAEHPGLRSARLSTRTGNLLIVYSEKIRRDDVVALLGDLRLFGVATITAGDRNAPPSFSERVTAACSREVVAQVTKPFIPSIIGEILSGWRIAMGLFGMWGRLWRGEIFDLLLDLAKFALFALRGKCLPLRFACVVGGAFIEHCRQLAMPEDVQADPVSVGDETCLPAMASA